MNWSRTSCIKAKYGLRLLLPFPLLSLTRPREGGSRIISSHACFLNLWSSFSLVLIYVLLYICQDFPSSFEGKESGPNAGDPGSVLGLGRSPGEENGNPLQYSCLETFHGQRSLTGYSPWGHKELDTTERLHLLNLHVMIGNKQSAPDIQVL